MSTLSLADIQGLHDREDRSPGRTVTEADVVLYAGLSGDYSTPHTDAEAMRSTDFGERIAHGLLGMALCSGLSLRIPWVAQIPMEALLGVEWEFVGPIRFGDTVRCHVRVLEVRPTSRRPSAVVTFMQNLERVDGTVLQNGRKRILCGPFPDHPKA